MNICQLKSLRNHRVQTLTALICATVVFVPNAAFGHPLKLSASLIEYDATAKTIKVECKVFIDDFQRSLMNSVMKGFDPKKVRQEDKPRLIERYFREFYSVKHNGRRLVWKVKSLVPMYQENVLVIQFEKVRWPLKKGDRLEIENIMFFRDFGYEQTNRIIVKIPPFKIDDGHAATVQKHVFSYVLGQTTK